MANTKRIAKNTMMLYFRQILIMFAGLYTVRVVLNALGSEDYGIYNVVAGVVTMFSFLSGSMATASQRFFSFDLGKSDKEHLKVSFSVTLQIYFLIAGIIILILESVGLWFVNTKLVIPAERLSAANCIFQSAVVSFILTLITTPYMASIIAHENMNIYAYTSMIEALLKIGIAFLLKLLPFDKLSLYGVLLALIAFINTGIYRFYCITHYEECHFRFIKDPQLFKEIIEYSGWNLFGSLTSVFKNQFTNILLNQFFGPVVNSAKAIASQVNNAVASFSQNFSMAVRPQIIKTYASQQKTECVNLVFYGCKITFFLMYIFSLPLILEMDFVLKFWLKNPPERAVIFTQMALIDAVIGSMGYPIMTLAQATGKIKLYQSLVGGIQLFNLPISYIALKTGFPAISVMIVAVCITFLAFIVRLFMVNYLADFPLLQFSKKVIFPACLVSVCSAVIPIFIKIFIINRNAEFFAVVSSSVIITSIFILFLGMKREERMGLFLRLKEKRKHIFWKHYKN